MSSQSGAAFLGSGLPLDAVDILNGVSGGSADVMDGQGACSAHSAQLHQAALPAGGELLWGEEGRRWVNGRHRPLLFSDVGSGHPRECVINPIGFRGFSAQNE